MNNVASSMQKHFLEEALTLISKYILKLNIHLKEKIFLLSCIIRRKHALKAVFKLWTSSVK